MLVYSPFQIVFKQQMQKETKMVSYAFHSSSSLSPFPSLLACSPIRQHPVITENMYLDIAL